MNFNKKILPSGLRIVTIPMKDNPTATVMVLVEAGSEYEQKKIGGISHFLEHLCFKGTSKRPSAMTISKELDGIGAQYNAFTSQEFTGYYAKAHSKHAGLLVDVVSDIYLNSTLPSAEIEKEKGVIIEEINMYNDLPQKKVQDVFSSVLYGDQPAGWNIAGTKENVASFQREQFVDYRAKMYVAPATLIVVAGNIKESEILKKIEAQFAGIQKGKKTSKQKVVETQTEPKFLCEERPTDQSHFVLGVRTFDTYSKNNATLRVLSGVLGGGMSSRLYQKMREELGICYYVSAGVDTFTDHGYLSVSAGVKNERFLEAIKAVVSELRKVRDEKIDETELRKVKDHLIGGLYLGLESSDSLADYYGFQEIMRKKVKKPEDVVKEINAVTSEEIKKLAGDIFVDKSLNLAFVGPKINSKSLKEALGFGSFKKGD